MKDSKFKIQNYLAALIFLFAGIFSTAAQSINQNAPTPIKTNEISGRIPARDVGDARLTEFFYTFNAAPGDVFINVVTKNFNGDIDVFAAANLRPLTKITIYADAGNNETGRVIYFRQPEKVILRIEARSPNDDAAIFQIKFAGSFQPSELIAETDAEPEVKSSSDSDVIVNSVGTIIGTKPKPTPTPKEAVAQKDAPEETVAENKTETPPEQDSATNKSETVAEVEKKKEDEKAIETDNDAKEKVEPQKPEKVAKPKKPKVPAAKNKTDEKIAKRKEEAEKDAAKKNEAANNEENNAEKPNPLANVFLKVELKNGKSFQLPMSEVNSVKVDQGVLRIVTKDGKIEKYSILDVAKMTIE